MAAVTAVDRCLGRLAGAVEEAGGALLITADHGNAERMHGADGATPHTAHTDGAPSPPCSSVRRAWRSATARLLRYRADRARPYGA